MLSTFDICCIYIQMHFTLYFFMEANHMNPDQTAPKGQSDLAQVIVCNKRLPIKEHIKQMRGADDKSHNLFVVTKQGCI